MTKSVWITWHHYIHREQRMKAFARSQPNLLAAFDDDEEDHSDADEPKKNGYPRLCDNGLMNGGGVGPRCQSNPNLLDDDAASTVSDASSATYSNQQVTIDFLRSLLLTNHFSFLCILNLLSNPLLLPWTMDVKRILWTFPSCLN